MRVIGEPLPNIPWEERPAGCSDVMWRSERNPIIPRDLIPCSNSIFNSAVVPFGEFAGVFRCDDTARSMQLHAGFSDDGVNWGIDPSRFSSQPTMASNRNWRTATIRGSARSKTATTSPGATDTTGRPSAWRRRTTSSTSTRWRTRSCRTTATACSFPENQRQVRDAQPSQRQRAHAVRRYLPERVAGSGYWGSHRHVMRPNGGWQATKIGAGPIPDRDHEGG